jgi:hypothetical protein
MQGFRDEGRTDSVGHPLQETRYRRLNFGKTGGGYE